MRTYIRFEEIPEEIPDLLPEVEMSVEMEVIAESGEFDVTDMTEEQRKDLINQIDELMAGKKYRIMLHKCFHDEDPTKPCELELIKEVT